MQKVYKYLTNFVATPQKLPEFAKTAKEKLAISENEPMIEIVKKTEKFTTLRTNKHFSLY